MKGIKYFGVAGVLLLIASLMGCATQQPIPEKTQLQIREFQTRTYDTNDYKMVMKAVLNTLQDDGYIIQQANVDLGLLTAKKEIDTTDKVMAGLSAFSAALGGHGNDARWEKETIIEATANITPFGEVTKVRVNFLKKKLNNRNEAMSVEQIVDEQFYQKFFSKVDKGIFIGKEGL
jgi:hypothetical protein